MGATLWPAGSSFKNSFTLPDAIIITDTIPNLTVQIRNETSVFKSSMLHALLSCCVQTSSFHKAVWQDFVGIVFFGFCIFDRACHTREKAEGKMLVSLEYMRKNLMFCFPTSAQCWQAGGTFNRKRKENSKTNLVVETYYWECFCYRLLLGQTSHLRSLPQFKPLVKWASAYFQTRKSHCNHQEGCYMQVT